MNHYLYLTTLVGLQILFLGLDFFHAFANRKKVEEKLKLGSALFVAAIILLYGLIQIIGVLLIPKIEVILQFFQNIIPAITLVNLNAYVQLPIIISSVGILTFYVSGSLWQTTPLRWKAPSPRSSPTQISGSNSRTATTSLLTYRERCGSSTSESSRVTG